MLIGRSLKEKDKDEETDGTGGSIFDVRKAHKEKRKKKRQAKSTVKNRLFFPPFFYSFFKF